MTPRVTVEGFEFHSQPTRTRFPFRYGIASMTEVPHLFVRARVTVDGRPSTGLASEGLPPKWFTKDPHTTFAEDLPVMLRVIGRAAEFARDAGGEPLPFFRLWQAVHERQSEWARRNAIPPLLTALGVSLCERAILDALCRALALPLHHVVRANLLGIDLGDIHAGLRGATPAEFLPARPLDTVIVRHTVGLGDPLTPDDIPPGERLDDGLPHDLLAVLRACRTRALKIKLSADLDRDVARLGEIAALLEQEAPDAAIVTLDGNENFRSFAGFRDYWSALSAAPEVQPILEHTMVVEQPVHRDCALAEEARTALAGWTDHPPIIIDESDATPHDLPRALGLGYAGTSHKNCKGIIKGIASACLIEVHRRSGRPAVLTGEDLCNLGPVALLQDLAMMALLGIGNVERNGHHYFRGLSPWPDDWQETARAAHPDLYVRDPAGFVRLDVRDGFLRLESVNRAPFGCAPLLDSARFPPQPLP